jgi:DNA topoisomerase-1
MDVLVITEKNNSARRIAQILSGGEAKRTTLKGVQVYSFSRNGLRYTVMALRGHIINLDYPEEYNDWDAVDPAALVNVTPVKTITANNIAEALRELVHGKDRVIIATDYDREGELIGVEALNILREVRDDVEVKRARFSALTKRDVEEAFGSLTDVDFDLAKSAESRQVVDLAWGASLTRLLSTASRRRGKDFLSVGRVQSPTLALVVDREREIQGFVSRPFWEVVATFEKEDESFQGKHVEGRFWNKEEAEAVLSKVQMTESGEVLSFATEEKREWAPPPFNTTAFLAEANKRGFGAAAAMRIAENLYTSGYISYPRTDNTVYPPTLSFRSILQRLTESDLGKEAQEVLDMGSWRPSRGKRRATDHPPIHPVGAAKKSKLKGERWAIYELVVRRFLATLSPPAIAEVAEARIQVNQEDFEAHGYRLMEEGWRRYYPYSTRKDSPVPVLEAGEEVAVLAVEMPEDETRPPPRFSQGFLLQEMEKLNLGTKSTRHDIIQKLYDRHYVDGKRIRPTATGEAVVEALEEHAPRITDAEMTATLEEDMAKIAEGEKELEEVIDESRDMLQEVVATLQEHREAIGEEINTALRKQNYVGKCKACGGDLMILRARGGHRFIGCSNYPECRVTHPLPPTGIVVPHPAETCEVCGSPLIENKRGRWSEMICVDSECPTMKEKRFVGTCPECGGNLELKHSRRGKRFVGCDGYPDCRVSYPLPQRGLLEPTEEACKTCGAPVVKIISKGRKPWVLCVNMECETKKDRGKAAA